MLRVWSFKEPVPLLTKLPEISVLVEQMLMLCSLMVPVPLRITEFWMFRMLTLMRCMPITVVLSLTLPVRQLTLSAPLLFMLKTVLLKTLVILRIIIMVSTLFMSFPVAVQTPVILHSMVRMLPVFMLNQVLSKMMGVQLP